jgi:hypothetical protein
MSKQEKQKTAVRITLDVSLEFHERLERLVGRVKADTKKDVIRDALQTYDFLLAEHLKGRKVLLEDDSGRHREVLLFPHLSQE